MTSFHAGTTLLADELRPGLDPLDVSPGLLGFLVVFALVVACIPLFRSLTGKLRGVEHRAAQEDRTAQPDGEASTVTDGTGTDGAVRPDGAAGRSARDSDEQGTEERPGGTGR